MVLSVIASIILTFF